MTNYRLEQFGLYLSLAMTFLMSVLGISFGVWIESEAILLDGFFNVVNFLMASGTLWIAWLQRQPESPRFHFGYLSFVPLVNLSKGLLILTLSLFALFSAISTLLHGGRMLNANLAVIYAIIAASGCLITAFIQRGIAQKNPSAMLDVDSKNWSINGLISLAVGMAFSLVAFLKNTPWAWFIPYADSTIVAVLVLGTIFIPIQIILQSANQLLLGAPSTEIQKQIKNSFEVVAKQFAFQKHWIRMTQLGNTVFISIYWLLPQGLPHSNVAQLDIIREQVAAFLLQDYPDLIIDIIFTGDEKWAGDIRFRNPEFS